jgi:hypothetical protein
MVRKLTKSFGGVRIIIFSKGSIKGRRKEKTCDVLLKGRLMPIFPRIIKPLNGLLDNIKIQVCNVRPLT